MYRQLNIFFTLKKELSIFVNNTIEALDTSENVTSPSILTSSLTQYEAFVKVTRDGAGYSEEIQEYYDEIQNIGIAFYKLPGNVIKTYSDYSNNELVEILSKYF